MIKGLDVFLHLNLENHNVMERHTNGPVNLTK